MTSKIVDCIQNQRINQLYIIGEDGTQKGASVIYQEVRTRGLKVSVIGIPKTINNDIRIIDKLFWVDITMKEAQRAINAADTEVESVENGIKLVKLMGRDNVSRAKSKMFVSGLCDSTARLWDTCVASRVVRTFYGHEVDVNTVKVFPYGNKFGTGSEDGTCRLFDIRTEHQLQVYDQPNSENEVHPVKSIAFSISGRRLFAIAGYSNGDCNI